MAARQHYSGYFCSGRGCNNAGIRCPRVCLCYKEGCRYKLGRSWEKRELSITHCSAKAPAPQNDALQSCILPILYTLIAVLRTRQRYFMNHRVSPSPLFCRPQVEKQLLRCLHAPGNEKGKGRSLSLFTGEKKRNEPRTILGCFGRLINWWKYRDKGKTSS